MPTSEFACFREMYKWKVDNPYREFFMISKTRRHIRIINQIEN